MVDKTQGDFFFHLPFSLIKDFKAGLLILVAMLFGFFYNYQPNMLHLHNTIDKTTCSNLLPFRQIK